MPQPAYEPRLQDLVDREAIRDTLYAYSVASDSFDWSMLKSTLAHDAVATYGAGAPIVGAQALVKWIKSNNADVLAQHHRVGVGEISIDGDHAMAVVYHTSHQRQAAESGQVDVIVGRYRNDLVRQRDRWLIRRLRLEVVWAERRLGNPEVLTIVDGEQPTQPPRQFRQACGPVSQ